MTEVQIIAIRKPGGAYNTHEAISDYKWRNNSDGETGISSREVMVDWINANPTQQKAFVQDRAGNRAYCIVITNVYGTTFLQTRPDSTGMDNLLRLPTF